MQSVSELVLNQTLFNTFPLRTNVALRCRPSEEEKKKTALKIYLIFLCSIVLYLISIFHKNFKFEVSKVPSNIETISNFTNNKRMK